MSSLTDIHLRIAWFKGHLKSLFRGVPSGGLLLVCTLVLAGCGTAGSVSSNPLETSATATVTQAAESNLVAYSDSSVWFTAKSGPYWQVLSVDPQDKLISDITPSGFSTRGGLAMATNGTGLGVIGLYPYKSLLASTLFVTTTAGKSWSSLELGGGLAPVRNAIAVSSSHIYALTQSVGGSSLSLFVGGVKSIGVLLRLPASLPAPSGILGVTGGVLAYGSGGRGEVAALYSESTKKWTAEPVSKGSTLTTVVTGSAGDYRVTAVSCVASSSNSVVTSELVFPSWSSPAPPWDSPAQNSLCANGGNGSVPYIPASAKSEPPTSPGLQAVSFGPLSVIYRNGSSRVYLGVLGPIGLTSLSTPLNAYLRALASTG